MSEKFDSKKKEKLKDIILKLHEGMSIEEAKEKFEKEIGDISATEIAQLEQSLINDGLTPNDIKKFCNVHALLFENKLKDKFIEKQPESHPVSLFIKENREIESKVKLIKELSESGLKKNKDEILKRVQELKKIEIHYTRKEQILFPYLEKHGFMGPSQVMWGKDDEIRDLLKKVINTEDNNLNDNLNTLLDEISGMIFKEENILFPASIEKLEAEEWVSILKESEEIGYVFIETPSEITMQLKEFKTILKDDAEIDSSGIIKLPTGTLKVNELMHLMNNLPMDISFVNAEDRLIYFSDNKDRIFLRTKSVLNREVKNCHPPKSVEMVEKILESFKSGKKNYEYFWIDMHGKKIYIQYFAVRDNDNNYLGTLEVVQDIKLLQSIEGEKRLINDDIQR